MKFNIKILNIKRKRNKYLDFILDIKPKSKKLTKNKSEIQNMFIEIMKYRNLEKIKGKVAIEITVFTNRGNPPRIETYVKNIVDIMHKTDYLINKDDEKYLPIKEDSLIKYLRAKYVFLGVEPQTHIKIRPFSSFVSDINFIDMEKGLKQELGENNNINAWLEYKELIKNREMYIHRLSKKAYNSMLKMKMLDVQKEICDLMSITPEIISLIYPKRSKYAQKFKDTYEDWASMLLDMPIRIHLPGIPLNKSKEEEYIKDIKEQMRQYLEHNPIFEELQSPILITAFYMAPRKKKKKYKDIDNIMLDYIMPAMNEVFHPPISLFNLGMKKDNNNKNYGKSFPIPRSLKGSAIGYEILELPYNFESIDTGYLKVGFRIENIESSVMGYVDKEIKKYIEENRYIE